MRLTTNFYDLIKEIYYKLELARFSTLLIESKTEPSVAKGGGDTTQKKYILEGGDTAHTLLRWGHRTYLIGVGTPHIPYSGWGHRTTLKEKA